MLKKALVLILVILLLPLIFKSRDSRGLVGPKLNDVHYTEVNFTNTSDGIHLGGMLFTPNTENPFPLVVIIQGSGYSNRNNSWYLSVAKHLQENGIGVLLTDKRGSEKSEGDWKGASLQTLATDTESAIEFVKTAGQINYSTIGLLGMSQGGWIAPIVSAKRQDLSFVINMSGSLTTSDDQLLYEEFHNIAPYTYNFIAKLISPLTTNNLKKRASINALLGFDPIPYWKKTTAPVFIAYGEDDPNCPVEESLQRLDKEHLNHFQNKVYPGGEHGILAVKTNRVNPDFLNDMTAFITKSIRISTSE